MLVILGLDPKYDLLEAHSFIRSIITLNPITCEQQELTCYLLSRRTVAFLQVLLALISMKMGRGRIYYINSTASVGDF